MTTMRTDRSFVSAILLAAGESRRMGQPKLLMPLGIGTMLEQTVGNLLRSRLDEIIVVLGHRARELADRISTHTVTIVLNPRYGDGMSTSIAAGLNVVSQRAAGVMIALADQPFVGPDIIDRLVAAFQERGKGIVIPVHRGKRGHPVIFSVTYRDELWGLRGDTGGREIISQHPGDVAEVAVESDSVRRDIDTPADYAASAPDGTQRV